MKSDQTAQSQTASHEVGPDCTKPDHVARNQTRLHKADRNARNESLPLHQEDLLCRLSGVIFDSNICAYSKYCRRIVQGSAADRKTPSYLTTGRICPEKETKSC